MTLILPRENNDRRTPAHRFGASSGSEHQTPSRAVRIPFSPELSCERRPYRAGFVHEAFAQDNEAAPVLEPVVTKVSAGQGQNARCAVSDLVRR